MIKLYCCLILIIIFRKLEISKLDYLRNILIFWFKNKLIKVLKISNEFLLRIVLIYDKIWLIWSIAITNWYFVKYQFARTQIMFLFSVCLSKGLDANTFLSDPMNAMHLTTHYRRSVHLNSKQVLNSKNGELLKIFTLFWNRAR